MSTPVVTIFVRHVPGCKQAGDEFSKRCQCKKHLRWSHNSKQYRRAANTRSWAEAEQAKREIEDQLSGKPVEVPTLIAPAVRTIGDCIAAFVQDKQIQDPTEEVLNKYRRELGRMERHFSGVGILTLDRLTRENITAYVSTWPTFYPASYTRWQVRCRHNSFFTFCHEAGWVTVKPKLPKIVIDQVETTPLTPDEYTALLAAIPAVVKDPINQVRVHAFFQLMRWTGLAIRDALTLERAEIHHDETKGIYRVVTSRQKTGTHVSVPIHPAVAAELLAVPNGSPEHLFWDGKQDAFFFQINWAARYVKPIWEAAGIEQGGQRMRSHRLRDTFAVELLIKGVPMEEVSKLLGHTSIKTTEKHYAKWAKGRQDRLDSLVTATWAA